MSTPSAIIAKLVEAWEAPVPTTGSVRDLAPACAVRDVLVERGYDEALDRARRASKTDPFAFHLGLERLARELLLRTKIGRPKVLGSLLAGLLPPRVRLPAEVARVLRVVERGERASFPEVARAFGTPEVAGALWTTMFAAPLAGSARDRIGVAERVTDLARGEVSTFFYPFLSSPDVSFAVSRAATDEKAGSAARDALLGAMGFLGRYVVDVRCRPLLLASIGSPSAEGRRRAAAALLDFAAATAWPKERWSKVIELLDDTDAQVREWAAFDVLASRRLLSASERQRVVRALERHLDDPVLAVRVRAVGGLATLLGRSFAPRLREMAKHEKNKTMRIVLRRALQSQTE